MSKQREHGCFPEARGQSLAAGPQAKSLAATVRCVLAAAILSSVPAACADDGLVPRKIYVAPDGNATKAGTQEDPWSLAKANEAAKPGDTIVLLDGTYTGTGIAPVRSGTGDKPITYRAALPKKAFFKDIKSLPDAHGPTVVHSIDPPAARLGAAGARAQSSSSKCRIEGRDRHE